MKNKKAILTALILLLGSVSHVMAKDLFMMDMDRSGNRVIAVGERGAIKVSTDGGSNWSDADSQTKASLTSVTLLNKSTAFAVGHDATIVKSLDGGKTWNLMYTNLDLDAPLFDIHFWDDRNGFAVGAYGTLLVTTDAGITWEQSYLGEYDYHMYQIIPINEEVVITGEMGTLFKFGKEGQWEATHTGYDGSLFAGDLYRNQGYFYSMQGAVVTSSNANELSQFSTSYADSSSVMNDATYISGIGLVAVGNDGNIIVTNSVGNSIVFRREDRLTLSSILDIDNNHVLLAGAMGIERINKNKLFEGEE